MPGAKPATAADVPALLALVAQYWAFEGIAGFDASRLSRQLERLCTQPLLGGAWIVHADGTPAGYLLSVYVFSLEHHGLTAEIDELFVLPKHRGRGLGAQLLHAAEAAATAAGCTNISLQLGRHNDATRVLPPPRLSRALRFRTPRQIPARGLDWQSSARESRRRRR